MAIDRVRFVERYIEPVIYHPFSRFAFKSGLEVVKVVATKKFLEFLARRFLDDTSKKLSQKEVMLITVFAPLLEEIIFRGLILGWIHFIQRGLRGEADVQTEELIEQHTVQTNHLLRVHFVSLIFATVYFGNSKIRIANDFMQFSFTYLTCFASGYFSEKKDVVHSPMKMTDLNLTQLTRFAYEHASEKLGKFASDILIRGLQRSVLVKGLMFYAILQRGFLFIQLGLESRQNEELIEKDCRTQQILRVHLAAVIFAAVHLTNSHTEVAGALVQFSWSYLGGVAYGYLSEKYETLSVSMLAHGFNNSLATAAGIYPEKFAPFFLIGIVVNKVGAYILGATSIDQKVISKVRQVVVFTISLPGRVVHWHVREAPAEFIPV